MPRPAGGDPSAPDPVHRAVDVEHLEHRLEPGARQLHARLQGGRAGGAVLLGERRQRRAHLSFAGEAHRPEIVPDGAVLGAGQHDHLGVRDAAAGAPDLLVVGDRRCRRTEVDDKAEVGLVEAHAQRGRRHERLDPVGEQIVLGGQTLGVLGLTGVRGHGEAPPAQVVGDVLAGGDGQRVDDAGAGQPVQAVGQPGEAVRRGRQGHCAQMQRFAVQAAAQYQHVIVVTRADTETQDVGDVGDHAAVRRGRGGQHRDARGQLGQQRAQPAEVRAEVVPPVADAVRLVDDEQPARGSQLRQDGVAELRVVQPLGREQQHVDLPCRDGVVGGPPFVDVGGVDGGRVDPGALRGGDLVAHQGEQRRDDHRRARPGGAQQRRGDEVDRRLAPSGALHHQRAPTVGHQCLDGAPLVVAQPRLLAGERAQLLLGAGAQLGALDGSGHRPCLAVTGDGSPAVHRSGSWHRLSPVCISRLGPGPLRA